MSLTDPEKLYTNTPIPSISAAQLHCTGVGMAPEGVQRPNGKWPGKPLSPVFGAEIGLGFV